MSRELRCRNPQKWGEGTTVTLMRENDRLEITDGMWAEILLFLTKRGWQPSFPAYYLLGNWEVPERDAKQLAAVGQKALDDALQDPLRFYPVPFDMARLADLVDFCKQGRFEVATDFAGRTYVII